jgi:hypothetical protein
MAPNRSDLEAYVERLVEALEADGVVLAIREEDRWELIEEEDDLQMLRRLVRLLDYQCGGQENMQEARDLLRKAAEDDE